MDSVRDDSLSASTLHDHRNTTEHIEAYPAFPDHRDITGPHRSTLCVTRLHHTTVCTGEANATQSSVLAWRSPWAEEPGGLQSTGSQESDTTWQLNHHHHHGQHRSVLCITRSHTTSGLHGRGLQTHAIAWQNWLTARGLPSLQDQHALLGPAEQGGTGSVLACFLWLNHVSFYGQHEEMICLLGKEFTSEMEQATENTCSKLSKFAFEATVIRCLSL